MRIDVGNAGVQARAYTAFLRHGYRYKQQQKMESRRPDFP